MGLLSYFKRNTDSATEASAPAAPDAVAAARTRARRRLIGAAVLLGVGVIGFPLLFETQPRPIPVDIPIEIPRKDGAPPLVLPHATPALSPASAAVVVADGAPPGAAPAEITERAGEQGRELPLEAVPAASKAGPARAPAAASTAIAAKPSAVASRPPIAASKPAAAKAEEGNRARALLDGQAAAAPASAAGARMVVQVGAFSEAAKLQEARRKLESMGFKTYTQVVEVDGAKRTRVRVGPFANRSEADKAAARIKAGGLPAAILTL